MSAVPTEARRALDPLDLKLDTGVGDQTLVLYSSRREGSCQVSYLA